MLRVLLSRVLEGVLSRRPLKLPELLRPLLFVDPCCTFPRVLPLSLLKFPPRGASLWLREPIPRPSR